jgi:phosphoglycolate phosphatase-like HAD superfamily hydrolase
MSSPRLDGPTVLLFDVDGTLISSDGAGRRAIERAFASRHGSDAACRSFSFAGMTDLAIARAGLAAIGVEPSEQAIGDLLDHYLTFLDEELRAAANFRVHAGIVAALDAADAATTTRGAAIAVGLGTGNVRAGAAKKLGHAKLWHRFAFGGFADDSEERAALIRAGAERGADRLRAPLSRCRVVVIGDTPLDVAAARANGFESLAVATGPIARDELAKSGAGSVVGDLAEPGAIERLLGL